jgi:SNF2 family DNA or RNA helicase
VVEGERLTYGHLFNPTFATELSLIEPLPHQRIAVYEKMLRQPRLRFLLADDAGAGKTIMSGLFIREMLSRRLIRRILIVPPAGLLGNWERELSTLFGMSFKIITSADSKQGNPFIGSRGSQIIISLDTLAGERMFSLLADPAVERYDLVVFDEAHKLSARQEADGTVRRTDRYRLAEALAGVRNRDNNERWKLGWSCRHLLLLTATPHMGKDFPYYCLWRLLEPEIFSTFDAFEAYSLETLQRYFTRRTKEEMVYLDGKPIYPIRNSNTQSVLLNQGKISEQTLYDEVTHYIRNYYNKARNLNRSAARLAMSVFQRRLASSTYALLQSLKNRRKKVEKYIQEFRDGKLSEKILAEKQQKLEGIEDVLDEKTADEETPQNGVEENEVREDQILESVVAKNLAELEVERMELDRLIGLAEKVDDLEEESKFNQLRVLITDPEYQQEKFLIFTEFRDTMEFLVRRLEGLGYTGQIAQIHGGMEYKEREEQVAFFKKPESEGGARFLVATDAAGEGINLQFCWISINYDIPWNPARLEQRMGRIHRFGQKHNPVVILNLVAGETREGKVLRTLLVKLESIRKRLGSDKVFSSIGRIFQESFLKLSMEKSLTDEGAEQAVQEIEKLDIPEKLQEIEKEEKKRYGKSEDVSRELPRLRQDIDSVVKNW